jgi:mRNA interferase MazF
MDPRPGDVNVVNLGLAGKIRPAVVLSRYDPDRPLALVSIAAVTSQHRGSRYEISLGRPSFLREDSWVNFQSVAPIDHHELGRKLGKLTDEQMRKIKEALRYLFDLP